MRRADRMLARAEIEAGGKCQEKGHDILIEGFVGADRAGQIPTVNRGFEDSHRQQFAPGPITRRVMGDAFERAALVKTRTTTSAVPTNDASASSPR